MTQNSLDAVSNRDFIGKSARQSCKQKFQKPFSNIQSFKNADWYSILIHYS